MDERVDVEGSTSLEIHFVRGRGSCVANIACARAPRAMVGRAFCAPRTYHAT